LAIEVSHLFFLENTIPKIINMIPTPFDAEFFEEPIILGSKKSTPATIQSIGANF
jgi:hypothetical protein